MMGPCSILTANLVAYPGGECPRYIPWDYAKKGFTPGDKFKDRSDWRFDENSKIIVIDGNVATGKTNIGKQIAKHFDLLYVPDVSDEEMYWWETDHVFDGREHDAKLPLEARHCDFQAFYSQTGFPTVLKNFPRTQYMLFRYKMLKYTQLITQHVLSTGQGVVMNRGMWSDMVFAETMFSTGHLSREGLMMYNEQYQDLTFPWWHPHLIVYLDTPFEQIKENIKKRNIPWETNSPVINDDWIEAMDMAYKEKYLPKMRRHCEVLSVDMSEELDIEVLYEELERVDLETPPEEYPDRFLDWKNNKTQNFTKHNRFMNNMRLECSMHNQWRMDELMDFLPPHLPEMWLLGPDYSVYTAMVQEDPRKEIYQRFKNNPLFAWGQKLPLPACKAPAKAR